METINLTVEGKEFNISRELLEKSDYFKGLLDIQDNNLVITDISAKDFKLLIYLLESPDSVMERVADLFDYLGFKHDCVSFKKYHCLARGCERLGGFSSYYFCTEHYCRTPDCLFEVVKGSDYCIHCKCANEGCKDLAIFHYCNNHKFGRSVCKETCKPVKKCNYFSTSSSDSWF